LAELRVDGGASANDALMQFQADILSVPVLRPSMAESTALGAALLAGLAVGFWQGLPEIAQLPHQGRKFEPQMPPSRAKELRQRWHEAVQRTKNWQRPQEEEAREESR